MSGPFTVMVDHLIAAGATMAAVRAAVADMENALADELHATVSNEAVAPRTPENATGVEKAFVADGDMRRWADAGALAAKGDPMVLKAAFEIAPGLSRTQRAIGVTLVKRFYNRKSMRCDPSAPALAAAARCNRASVFRAIPMLEATGIMRHDAYAGNHNANAYRFDFDRAAALVLAWQQSQNNKNATVKAQKPLQQSQTPVANATQTHIENINTSLRGSREIVARASKLTPAQQAKRDFERKQQNMMLPIDGGRAKSPQHAEIAENAAQKRLWKALNARFAGTPSHQTAIVQASIREAEWQEALAAETRRHGSGLQVFLNAIARPAKTGSGPP